MKRDLNLGWIGSGQWAAWGAGLTVILAGMTPGCLQDGVPEPPQQGTEVVQRGEYLVAITGCHDCHTPWVLGSNGPEPDMTRMLSGHPADLPVTEPALPADGSWWAGSATNTAFVGPWGISYAFNLTPDINTGLGIWTEEMFVRALRTGRHMGVSRPIQPPMPWKVYSNMTDEDLTAIYAYLRTIPPIENLVPDSLNTEDVLAMRLREKKDRRFRPS